MIFSNSNGFQLGANIVYKIYLGTIILYQISKEDQDILYNSSNMKTEFI